jgi:uncharacterized damage-inducible protein DinB
VIDEFRSRWDFVRGMTTEFLREASDECLDLRPTASFMTIREQAGHLSEVQGAYQLALRGEEPDFSRKAEFAPRSLEVPAILDALAARDRELDDLLAALRPKEATFRIPWYGNEMSVAGFGAVFIQHESLHHGQWAAVAALGDFPRPIGWLLNWGL